jgi:hypothetical protein
MRSSLLRMTGLNVFALLTALLLIALNGKAVAQVSTRPFQMSLWENTTGGVPNPTPAQTDVRSFAPGDTQPTTPAIFINVAPNATLTPSGLTEVVNGNKLTFTVNWALVVAVEVDEPYSGVDGDLDSEDCASLPPTGELAPITAELSSLETQLTSVNPKARFWVNFTQIEGLWEESCGINNFNEIFNGTYIDVISMDFYSTQFYDGLYQFYWDLSQSPATPHQQLALIPGVFSATPSQLPYLPSYIGPGEYPSYANQTCNLPLGPQGVTGFYDGCLVWVVMGWMTGDVDVTGILDPASTAILDYWEQQVALRPVQPRKVVPAAVLELLLE